jgi:hypothetical protein
MISLRNFVDCRYGPDNPDEYGLSPNLQTDLPKFEHVHRHLLSSAVRITPELFPELARAFTDIDSELGLSKAAQYFVAPDPHIQAQCCTQRAIDGEHFTVILSSGLVERLLPPETRFVIGHEIAHFLCEHWRYPIEESLESMGEKLAALNLSRAAEISADRIGLLAAESFETACAAMIKTAAGLGAPHLRPDIPSLLRQFRELSDGTGHAASIWNTHPSIPLRIRALLRFEPIVRRLKSGLEVELDEIALIDRAIHKDFSRCSGFALEKLHEGRLEKACMWAIIAMFTADGILSKWEQDILVELLGEEATTSVLSHLKDLRGMAQHAAYDKAKTHCQAAKASTLAKKIKIVRELESLIQSAHAEKAKSADVLAEVAEWLGIEKIGNKTSNGP